MTEAELRAYKEGYSKGYNDASRDEGKKLRELLAENKRLSEALAGSPYAGDIEYRSDVRRG